MTKVQCCPLCGSDLPVPRNLMMRDLIEIVAHEHDVTVEALKGCGRRKLLSWARQDFMHRAREAGFSSPRIGAFIGGRDHTTITHGVAQHARRLSVHSLNKELLARRHVAGALPVREMLASQT